MTGKIRIFLLLTLFIKIYGEEKFFDISIDSNPVVLNAIININITINQENIEQDKLNFTAPEYPKGIVFLYGPYTRPVSIENEDGTFQQKLKSTYTFRAAETGKFIMNSFQIIYNGKTYKSEPFIIKVGNLIDGKIIETLKAEWKTSKKNLYVGETAILTLNVLEIEEITFFDTINVTNPGYGFFEKIESSGTVEKNSIGNIILYNLPVALYAFTPSRPGTIMIPQADIKAGKIRGSSKPIYIDVKPLPKEILETGAVGKFEFLSDISKSSIKEGEEITLSIRIEGEGNLNYLQIPEPVFENLILSEKFNNDNYEFIQDRFAGWKEYVYKLIGSEQGIGKITIKPFSWMDPFEEKIFTSSENVMNILINKQEKGSQNDDPNILKELKDLIGSDMLLKMNRKNIYQNWLYYLLILPCPILWLIIYFKNKIKPNKQKILNLSILAICSFIFFSCPVNISQTDSAFIKESFNSISSDFYNNNFQDAEKNLISLSKRYHGNSGLLFNRAVILHRMQQNGEAILILRKAVYIDPMNIKIRKALKSLEDKLGLQSQVKPAPGIDPDYVLILLIVLINTSCLWGIFYNFKRSGKKMIVLILLFCFSLFSAFWLFSLSINRKSSTGVVVKENVFIKKIPRPTASDWITFPEGSAFKIKGETDTFFLIETSYKVKGWIEKEKINKAEEAF